MGRIRYINGWECQFCFETHTTEKDAKKCCGDKAMKIEGFECKQCFKVFNNPIKARVCHPELKRGLLPGTNLVIPVDEYDVSDEIIIGEVSISEELKE